MIDQESTRPETPTGPRSRAARRILRLREEVRRYRRLSVGFGSGLLVAVAVLAALALRADTPERVDLGTGVAGVEESAPEAPGPVVVPRDRQPPLPPSERDLGEGSASYYHDALEGRRTASGEPYRRSELTAAHRSLPFGSRVRVSNPANGRSVVVRINDRGPFAHNRVIDLSRSAASRLGMLSQGHGRVRLELLE